MCNGMTPAQLKRAGRKLYGTDWKSPLARELGISRVMVWRYATGVAPIPKKIALAIKGLLP